MTNSRQKGADGRFLPYGNTFKEDAETISVYNHNDELLFFTDIALAGEIKSRNWCKMANGYSATRIDGKEVLVHRFITKPRPNEVVDHINRDKRDNRISNLRNTDKSVNSYNSKINSNNTSGVTGVWWRKDTKKWCAEIKNNGKKISLGCFKYKEDAIRVRREAEVMYCAN